jgi:hypothetical protein
LTLNVSLPDQNRGWRLASVNRGSIGGEAPAQHELSRDGPRHHQSGRASFQRHDDQLMQLKGGRNNIAPQGLAQLLAFSQILSARLSGGDTASIFSRLPLAIAAKVANSALPGSPPSGAGRSGNEGSSKSA